MNNMFDFYTIVYKPKTKLWNWFGSLPFSRDLVASRSAGLENRQIHSHFVGIQNNIC
jgi:hypothetical protein